MTSGSMLLDALIKSFESGADIPEMMRADERSSQREVVMPGDVPWLPAADWHRDTVVSVKGHIVRLVLLRASNPGHGALKRLVSAIKDHGLRPVIIEPTIELQKTLLRWGWRGRYYGSGITSETRWKAPFK